VPCYSPKIPVSESPEDPSYAPGRLLIVTDGGTYISEKKARRAIAGVAPRAVAGSCASKTLAPATVHWAVDEWTGVRDVDFRVTLRQPAFAAGSGLAPLHGGRPLALGLQPVVEARGRPLRRARDAVRTPGARIASLIGSRFAAESVRRRVGMDQF